MRKVKAAATGGLLKMSIGGQAGIENEKYDRRRDYQAYAEGDMVEDESLMSPLEIQKRYYSRS